ncbi:MAG: hypothetical protein OEV29_09445 [Thermoleophilia bacterium]|nr:hypothetical protein [Thermoleophilia bacterium]MDH4340838.1 hypothetical protein [Thermoleophilia bacterium]
MSRAVLAIAAMLALAVPAAAGPPGSWSRLPGTVINFAEPGLARTSDGVLHVLYVRKNGTNSDLAHVSVSPAGKVGAATVALGGWRSMNHPDVIRMPDGSLRTFFGGIRTTAGSEPNRAMNTATAPASGGPWTLQIGKAAQSNSAYSGATAGAGLARDGTPISAWYSTGEMGFHYGTSLDDPDRTVPATGCCLYEPEIAVDAATGQAYIGFFSLEKSAQGVYAQRISPAGVQGARWLAPGTRVGANALNPGGRTSLSARIGAPGVFMVHGQGYPTFKTVAVSRVGAGKPQIVLKADRAEHINVAAAPDGRLWLVWEQSGTIFATRTNKAAKKVGPVTKLKPPGGGDIYRLNGEGSAGPLELVANISSNGQSLWHQQVLPGLQLTASSRAAGASRVITFRALDAGDPVAGAVIKIGGKTLRTAKNGSASYRAPGSGPVKATASKTGYRAATTTVR